MEELLFKILFLIAYLTIAIGYLIFVRKAYNNLPFVKREREYKKRDKALKKKISKAKKPPIWRQHGIAYFIWKYRCYIEQRKDYGRVV